VSRRVIRRLAALGAALVGLALTPAAGAAASADPFHGVVPQGPTTERDVQRMAAGGAESVRIGFAWWALEPGPGQFQWEATDAVVLKAARRGITVLPSVSGTAPWAGEDAASPPIFTLEQRAAWSAFLGQLVARYGPGGTIWQGVDAPRPIRVWQIWNEPNFPRFYRPEPSPRGYARLIELSAGALRGADPGAKVMLGGVAPVISGPRPQHFMGELYEVPGIKRHFDFVALHPYARGVGRLAAQVRRMRAAMARARDGRTPLAITEMGWASKRSPGTLEGGATRGPRGQARMVTRAYDMVERHRREWRLDSAYWFAWQDSPEPELRCSFCQYAGLFDVEGRPKPSWRAYRRAAASP
jgi:hypothetical protein